MFTVIKNNRPLVTIHIPQWAQKHEFFAAEELSKYLKKITETEVEIKQGLNRSGKPAIVIADLSHPATPKLLPKNIGDGLQYDGFKLKNIKDVLYIVANEAAGVVSGVYDYLRRTTGCAFLDHGERGENIPQMNTISHPELDIIDNPDFWCRGMQWDFTVLNDDPRKKELIIKKVDWMAKNGFSYLLVGFGDLWDETKEFILEEINKRGIKLEMGHHFFGNIAPDALYLQERPDLFPLLDNKRQPTGQLRYCLSNEDFIELASRKVIQEMTDNPAISIFDFWPGDFGGRLCECKNCLKIDDPKDKEATDWKNLFPFSLADRGVARRGDRRKMRRYLHLANQVAERVAAVYPKVKISVLAYLDTVDPPASEITIHPNIIINLAMAWQCSAHTIDDPDCCINSQFYDTLKQWTKVVDPKNIILYGYYMGLFGWYSLPYPIVKNLFQEWDMFKNLGTGGVQVQSLIKQMGVYGLNYFAVSRLTREDHLSFNEFLKAYCNAFFGPAAGPMIQVFLEWEQCIRRDKTKHVCPKPCLYIDNAFSRESTQKCRKYIDKALSLTEDGLYRWRVERIRSLVNYIDLWLDLPMRGKMLSDKKFTAEEQKALDIWLKKLNSFCLEHLNLEDDLFSTNCADHLRQVLERRVRIL